jgi:hypothetical protein
LKNALAHRGWWEPSELQHATHLAGRDPANPFFDDYGFNLSCAFLIMARDAWGEKSIGVPDALGLTKPKEPGARWEWDRRTENIERCAETGSPEGARDYVLRWLDDQILMVETDRRRRDEIEQADRKSAAMRVAVDVSPSGEKLGRYESRHFRAFHTAFRALIALWKARAAGFGEAQEGDSEPNSEPQSTPEVGAPNEATEAEAARPKASGETDFRSSDDEEEDVLSVEETPAPGASSHEFEAEEAWEAPKPTLSAFRQRLV